MKRWEITAGQIAELLALARRLTPDEYQARHRWFEMITDPRFDPDMIRIDVPENLHLGDGWIFTVEEMIELEVDDTTESDEILQRGVHNPADWKYLGKKPESITRKVKAAIGRLNQAWTEEGIAKLLSRPDCPLKGSGAWVREAYIKARPRYDEKGWIGFPDSETSRWRDRVDGGVYFPNLWRGSRGWRRGLTWTGRGCLAGLRICLLRG